MIYLPKKPHEVEIIKRWVNERLPDPDDFRGAYAFAIFDDDNEIAAAALYSDYSSTNVFLSGAVSHKGRKYMTRAAISAMLALAFEPPMNCLRITAFVSETNKQSERFVQRLGFIQEGAMRDFLHRGEKTLVYGLTRDDFSGGAYGWQQEASNPDCPGDDASRGGLEPDKPVQSVRQHSIL